MRHSPLSLIYVLATSSMSFISRNNMSDSRLLVYIRSAFPVNRGVSVWQINWAFLNRSDFPNGKFWKPWSVLLLTEKQRKLFIQERRINNIGGQLYILPFFFCFTSFVSQPAPIEKKGKHYKVKNQKKQKTKQLFGHHLSWEKLGRFFCLFALTLR